MKGKLAEYERLVHEYAPALDLMSSAGLAELKEKIAETALYEKALADTALYNTHLATPSFLDVGSGVGLPVVPLAVRLPHLTFYAVERRKRRAAFLKLVSALLELTNLHVIEEDVRKVFLPPLPFFTAQAVGTFLRIYTLTRHLHAEDIAIVSRRGPNWQRELSALENAAGVPVTVVADYALPSHGRLVALELPGGRTCRP